MKNTTKHTGILRIIERLPSSKNGNPRFLCFISETETGHGVKFYTLVDSSYGYSIQNYEGKLITVAISTHYGKPTLNRIIK